MRVANESELCTVNHKSEVTVNEDGENNRPTSVRVPAFEFSLEGKSIQLEPRVRDDPRLKASQYKASSPQQLRIDLQREQGIRLPTKNKSAGRRRSKALQRRQSEQRKAVKELPESRRQFVGSRPLIPSRTPLVLSKMNLPTEGQKFNDDNAIVINTAEEASNVVKRLLGTNSVVEEATSTKKVTKQVAIKGNINTTQSLTEALQQEGTQAITDAASRINTQGVQQVQQANRDDTNNNSALSEINSSNQVVNSSQQTSSKKTTTSSSSTVSSKTTKRESYSTQTHVQESFSSSYEDVEDNSGVAAICSPEQVQSSTNVNKSSKTTKQTEIRQSTLQSTSSIDSDVSSLDAENIQKAVKQDTQKINQQNTTVQKSTIESQKNVTEQAQVVQQNVTEQAQVVQQNVNQPQAVQQNVNQSQVVQQNLNQSQVVQQNVNQSQVVQQNVNQSQVVQQNVNTAQNVETQQQVQQKKDTEKITSENTDYTEQTKTMSMEEFQKIRKIKEYITIQRKLRNAEDGDTEEEEEESHEAEKIMSVDDVRQRLANKPPKEIVNDNTKDEKIVKGSRIVEIRTVTKTIYPNPDNADQEIEYETVTIDRNVVPAGTSILTSDDKTETTQKQVVTGQESTVKKTTTESQKVQQAKTQVTESTTGTQNVQNVEQVQTAKNVQQVQTAQNVQTNQQNVQEVQTAKNVQQVQTAQNVQTNQQKVQEVQTAQNVQNVQQTQTAQNVQNVQQTQTAQNIQQVQTAQNVQNTNVENVQQVKSNTQNVQTVQETQNVQKNIQETQNVQKSVQDVQNIQSQQLIQNEAVKKTSVNTVKQTQKSTLTSTSSIDSDTSSLDEASRLVSNIDNQNRQLVDTNQTIVGGSTVTQTSSKTTKVTESRKVIKQSSSAAPETFVEESSQTHKAEKVVNATCGADGKFNLEENTKSSTTVSSGFGDEDDIKRQTKTQNKELTKKLVSDGKVVVADVDQYREKIVKEEQGSRDQPSVTFSKTTSDSKHKHMEEDASKFEQPALPSPDSGSISPMSPIDFQPSLQGPPSK